MNKLNGIISIAFIAIFNLACWNACAQIVDDFGIAVPIPQSPRVAEINKYGVYPVSDGTGLPDIKVPLHSIDCGSFTLPLMLSYHASGIKVNQIESEVGLGWSISGIGTISRSIMGKADESLNSGNFETLPSSFADLVKRLEASNSQSISENFYYLRNVSNSTGFDAEPDVFSYNLGGRSGRFIYTNERKFVTIPFEPIMITKSEYTASRAFSFTIIDEFGVKYVYDKYGYSIPDIGYPPYDAFNPISAWYLTKITSADGMDEVSIEYIQHESMQTIPYQEQTIGRQLSSGMNNDTNLHGLIENKNQITNHVEQRIKKIKFKTGEMVFNYSSSFLNEVSLIYLAGVEAKRFSFKYNDADMSRDRVRLLKFQENDLENDDVKEYVFTYNSDRLPLPNTAGWYSQDYWGYFNGKTNHGLIPLTTLSGMEISIPGMSQTDLNNTWSIGNADRNVSESHMKAASLQKITYPTGGYTEFDFETHKYLSTRQSATLFNYGGKTSGAGHSVKKEDKYSFVYGAGLSGIPETKQATISIEFSPPIPPFPMFSEHPQLVTLRDLTDERVILKKWHDRDANFPLTYNETVTLNRGHQYELAVTVYGDNVTTSLGYEATYASAYIRWQSDVTVTDNKIGGGLRVKSVRSFDKDGNLLNETSYKYGHNEDGIGVKLFEENLLFKNYIDQYLYTLHNSSPTPGLCNQEISSWQRRYMGISSYSAIVLMVTPIVYDKVTKYVGLAASRTKQELSYQVNRQPLITNTNLINSGNYGRLNQFWFSLDKTSDVLFKGDHEESYKPLFRKDYYYGSRNFGNSQGTLVNEFRYFMEPGGECQGFIMGSSFLSNFHLISYLLPVSRTELTSETHTSFVEG